jgi:HAMP domain-containing protein
MLRGLLHKARKLATDAITGKAGPPEPERSSAAEAAKAATRRDEPESVLRRVHVKAERGLKPEDRVVVVYFTQEELEAVVEIRKAFEGIETTIREMDLAKEPPQTMRQLANNTGVMVPPWVYINGRYWGGQFEMTSLRACGDLELVVANRLDEIGEEAKRIGKVRESWSDEISVENILARWEQGHILCVDDLDAWYEVAKDGTPHFFYEGGERPVEDMRRIAEEIVAAALSGSIEAHWQLEPSVHVG